VRGEFDTKDFQDTGNWTHATLGAHQPNVIGFFGLARDRCFVQFSHSGARARIGPDEFYRILR
jgi:hypothetical protein